MTTANNFTQKLKTLLSYDRKTGVFTWKVWRGGNSPRIGAKAGFDHEGYIKIGIDRVHYYAHRLAWCYVFGKFPESDIDHINGNKKDNRIYNLREVTKSANQHNRWKARKDSTIGIIGVGRNHKGFRASIVVSGKRITLGTFSTPELAGAAYLEAKNKYHPQ